MCLIWLHLFHTFQEDLPSVSKEALQIIEESDPANGVIKMFIVCPTFCHLNYSGEIFLLLLILEY